jgi:hypothetical protein
MAAPADRWVSESPLRELLASQGEAYDLDYKAILNIQNNLRHRLKPGKLTAAMTAFGGDIVIGVGPRGGADRPDHRSPRPGLRRGDPAADPAPVPAAGTARP